MGQNSIRDYNLGTPGRMVEAVRLDSWKEIASYLHRDARTVRRWEQERRLPVHRVPGGERSGVFAYVSELEHWLRQTDAPPPMPSVANVADSPVSTSPILLTESKEFESHTAEASERPQPVHGFSRELLQVSTPNEAIALASSASRGAETPAFVNSVESASAQPISPTLADRRGRFEGPRCEPFAETVHSASMQKETMRWAVQAMALLLVLAMVGGSSFAFIHYRRFHVASAEPFRPSPEAEELYLRGRYYWNLRTEAGLNQAVDLFTQSIVNDPHYAPAYAGLADSYLLLRQYGHMPDAEAYPRALAAARQAVALDPESPAAHRSVAFILYFWNWNMPSAEREYLRALELDPKNSQSHHWYATALFSSGRMQEALAQIDMARALEPQSVSVLADRGLILGFKDPEQGEEALKEVTQVRPDFASAHTYLSNIYLDQGDYAGFLAETRVAATLAQNSAKITLLDQARRDLATHGPQFMLSNMAAGYAELVDQGQGSAYATARLFAFAGDSAQAIRSLELSYDRHDPGFLSVGSDVAFRHVRSSPEYLALIARKDSSADSRREPIAHLDRTFPF